MEEKVTVKSVLNDTKGLGVKAFLYLLLIIGLYISINTILFVVSLYVLNGVGGKTPMIIEVVLGILSFIISVYVAYKYIIVEAIHVVYKNLRPFFRRLCKKIIEKQSVSDKLSKVVSIDMLLTEVYGCKVPSIIRKGISFIIDRIPIVPMLIEIKDVIKNGTTQEAEDALFVEMDKYIVDSIFKPNTIKPVFIICAVNILLQIGVMLFFYFRQSGIADTSF